MIKGFRDFLMRGNVVDLAVAVVMGVAFGAVVSAFAHDFIGGIIGAIFGSPHFNVAGVRVHGSTIIIGSTINALISFVIVALAVYFFVVVPVNKVRELQRRGDEPQQAPPPEDIQLLTEIRDLLRTRTERADDTGAPTQRPPGYYERL